MKQRHIILNQNSHGVYKCLCGARWTALKRLNRYRCPFADKDPAQRA